MCPAPTNVILRLFCISLLTIFEGIFKNLYGLHDWSLKADMKRVRASAPPCTSPSFRMLYAWRLRFVLSTCCRRRCARTHLHNRAPCCVIDAQICARGLVPKPKKEEDKNKLLFILAELCLLLTSLYCTGGTIAGLYMVSCTEV